VNHYYLISLLALDIAREREREAEQRWLVAGAPSRPPRLRRLAARLLATISRGSASIARRLDSCIADDLGRSLAPAE
jgi:hypothetical protein